MKMDYKQVVDEYRLIEVTMRTRIDGKFHPIPNATINILMKTDDKDQLLANINTNTEGIAELAINHDFPFYTDDEGKYTLLAKFKGSDTLKKANKKVKARDLKIKANFTEKHTININAFEQIGDSLVSPEKEIGYNIYVERIFTDLKLASGDLVNGKATTTIPDDIPGDIDGNIKLHIIVDERDYQVVELSKTINWGAPVVKDNNKKSSTATISYVVFMILSTIIIAIFGLLLSRRINNKS